LVRRRRRDDVYDCWLGWASGLSAATGECLSNGLSELLGDGGTRRRRRQHRDTCRSGDHGTVDLPAFDGVARCGLVGVAVYLERIPVDTVGGLEHVGYLGCRRTCGPHR
jgi:hypothetical protein